MADTAVLDPSIFVAPRTVQVLPLPVPDISAKRVLPWLPNELHVPQQPHWLRLYRTARPALDAVLWNRASIALFHFESNCLSYGLPVPPNETDTQKFARWCAGADRAIKHAVHEQAVLGGIAPRLGIHDDGTRDALEVLRINSGTPTVDPHASDSYFYERPRLLTDLACGRVRLWCQPDGWGMYASSKLLHSGPAAALPDGTPLVGPHLPSGDSVVLGRNRVFRKPGAEFLSDDVGP